MKQTIDRCYQMPRDSVARGGVGEIWKGISAPPRSAFQTDFAKRSASRPIDGSEEGGVMGRQSSGGGIAAAGSAVMRVHFCRGGGRAPAVKERAANELLRLNIYRAASRSAVTAACTTGVSGPASRRAINSNARRAAPAQNLQIVLLQRGEGSGRALPCG